MSRRLLAIAAVDHPGGAEVVLPRLLGGLTPTRLEDHADRPREARAALS
jgi:hypothetical protein